MTAALIVVFVLAYAAIALEEPLKVNKSAAALIGAGLLWTIYALASGDAALVDEELGESLVDTAQIAFFLLGAMTIVEVVDAHDGFDVITSRLRARTLATLLLFICCVTFFLSAVLDNLTTTIVMISLVKRLLREHDERLVFAGMIVISANAGGAWSPMGDVTTTMLWIGGQVTSLAIVTKLIVPSLVNMLVPLAVVAYGLRGKPIVAPDRRAEIGAAGHVTSAFERNLMFALGLAALLAVPVFKAVTHLPPFLGILFGLGLLWAIGDRIHREKPFDHLRRVTIANALTRIDMSAITFFIGILLAVATLEHSGVLSALAGWLDAEIGRLDIIVVAFGLWEFMAYCAGTGGSILIIGSAAGVAAMGVEKIDFLWYMRRFAGLALAGYFAGALVYVAQTSLLS